MTGESAPLPSREDVEAAIRAILALRRSVGGPAWLMHKRVLVIGPPPSLALAAVIACHKATVTVVGSPAWDRRRHPRFFRDLLMRLYVAAPDTDPVPIGDILRRGGFTSAALRCEETLPEALGKAGNGYDLVVTWDVLGSEVPDGGVLGGLTAATVVGGRGFHRARWTRAEAERVLAQGGFALRSYEEDGTGLDGATCTAFAGCRLPHPVGLEYPALDSSDQILAHSRARYEFAAQFARGARVLDLGCGAGLGTRRLASAGAAVVQGLDKRAEALALARRDDPRHGEAYRQGDLNLRLPYEDGTFDLVVCLEVLEHVEDQAHLVGEIDRALAPDGVAVVSVPHRPFEDFWTAMHDEHNPYHEHVPDLAEFRTLLRPFAQVDVFVQTDVVSSVVLPLGDEPPVGMPSVEGRFQVKSAASLRDLDTLTVIAVCRKRRRAEAAPVAGPVGVSYGGYQGELGRLTKRIQELEASLAEAGYALHRINGFLKWGLVAARPAAGESWMSWARHALVWMGRTAVRARRLRG